MKGENMTDIALFIKDPHLNRLIRLEFERIGKSVGADTDSCNILITDTKDALESPSQNKILISHDTESIKNTVVLKRPVDMAELRLTVDEFFKLPTQTNETKSLEGTKVKLLKEEKSALIGNSKIPLTENEFILLSELIEKSTPISRDEINSLLNASGNTPEVYICALRKKLTQNDGVNPIITVRGKGYKLR